MLTYTTSINDIERAEWDGIAMAARAPIFSSWSWLSMSESPLPEDEGFQPGYVCVREPDGRIAGALPRYLDRQPHNAFYDPARMFAESKIDEITEPGLWAPSTVTGPRSGYRSTLLVQPSLAPVRRAEVVADLVGRCLADEVPVRFLWLDSEDANAVGSVLGQRGLLLFTDVAMDIDVTFTDMDGYLAGLHRNRRTSARREMADFAASGASVSVHRLDDVLDEVVPLYANLLQKHGAGDDALARSARFLSRHASYLSDHSLVWLSRRDGKPSSFSLFYKFGDGLVGRFVGFDYELAANFDYFNLLFYEPLRYAIENGFSRIHCGIGSVQAKLARGATPRSLWSVLYVPDGFSDDARQAARSWNLIKIDDFAVTNSRHVQGDLDVSEWKAMA